MKVQVIGPNRTVVSWGNTEVLISYDTPVAARQGDRWYRTNQKYSTTTSRHINQWLDGKDAECRDPSWFEYMLSCSVNGVEIEERPGSKPPEPPNWKRKIS